MELFKVGFVCSCTQYTVLCRQLGLTSLVYFPFITHNGENNSTSPVLFTEPSCQFMLSLLVQASSALCRNHKCPSHLHK